MDFFTNLGIPVWSIVKIAVLFALLIYIIFSVVVIKQVRLMIDTLDVGFDKVIRATATAHLIFAIAVFLLALIIL
jgi:hypothetical protein